MADVSLSPIVRQIKKSRTRLSKAEAKTPNAVVKRRLHAKIQLLNKAEALVEKACGHAGLTVKVPSGV